MSTPKVIATIEGHQILWDGEFVSYVAKAAIDGDGSSNNPEGDPDFQPSTSLKVNGASLNADIERYIVVPPAIIRGVAPVVLGSQAWVSYKGREMTAVVADVGPKAKIGEISIACAKALGIPSSPLSGGVPSGVSYKIRPGVAAFVDEKHYPLQPS